MTNTTITNKNNKIKSNRVLTCALMVCAFIPSSTTAAPVSNVGCPFPTLHMDGTYTCPDQTLSLEQRRNLFEEMKPFDKINGVKLDDYWPATAGHTSPISKHSSYEYNNVSYKGFSLFRDTGERAPIHYHEVAQLLCLDKGKILVKTEGEADKTYTAPDCYMMPAYTKVSVISLETKVEDCLLRVPKGGLDWVVIEPDYYYIQDQWQDGAKSHIM